MAVIVLRGRAVEIQNLLASLKVVKGIKHRALMMMVTTHKSVK
jgi:metal-responsive CopG/Arc/MetJ family transcriptional regulator